MKRIKGPVVVATFFGLFWCSITGAIDFVAFRNIYRQLLAKSYSTAPARIIHSEVVRKGKHKGVDIRYTFQVEGRQYQSGRYRYDEGTSSDSAWAYAAVRENPVGSERLAHYHPRDPSEAVLSVGLQGSDLFLPMFLTPFNAIGLGLLLWPVIALKRRLSRAELPGIQVMRSGLRTTVRLPSLGPFLSAAVALGLGAFFMTFVVAFTSSGFHPSFEKMLVAWVVVLMLALGVFGWRWVRVTSGAEDLLIDVGAAAISLPMTFGRKRRVTASIAELREIEVREVRQRGRGSAVNISYAPTLVFRESAQVESAKLAEYGDEESARRLVKWLRRELGLRDEDMT